MRKRLREILHDSDLLHASKNACLSLGTLHLANITFTGAVSLVNKIYGSDFDLDLNAFKSIEHFAIGAFAGAFTYRKMGGGLKGAAYGLAAATGYNLVWESAEPFIKGYNGESLLDTASDITAVYAGGVSSFLLEKYKSNLNKDKDGQK